MSASREKKKRQEYFAGGGVDAKAARAAEQKAAEKKAKILYDYLDGSKRFSATVREPFRSLMNVPLVTGDAEMDAAFIQGAKQRGLINVKGHRSVGGFRASLYNALPMESVEALVACMKEFEAKH